MRAERVSKLLALSVKAGVAYAVTVFAIGFVLGTARVLLLVPRVGSTIAVSVESPIILTASWYVSRIWMARPAVGVEIRPRILVGAVAFVTLMILEVALSISVFHIRHSSRPESQASKRRDPCAQSPWSSPEQRSRSELGEICGHSLEWASA
jgi:hypothetical protein